MMAPSVSWADRQRISALLSRVHSAPARDEAPPAPAVGAPLRMAPSAAPTRPTHERVAPRATTSLRFSSDNPVLRLDELLAWTLETFACAGAFVADEHGLTLAAEGIRDDRVALVGPLLEALDRVRVIEEVDAMSGSLRLRDQTLNWVQARFPSRSFCLGVVTNEALPHVDSIRLRDALAETLKTI